MAVSISDDYQRIGERIAALLGHPGIVGLHLPAPAADETFRDEFGFVFLADGSVGPFYVSMGDILQHLWQRYPDPGACTADLMGLLQGFSSEDQAERALALGAYNALSAALYRATGFAPPDRKANSGLGDMPPGPPVGMVGYFSPLVDKLTAQGCEVLILERSPERVADRTGVSVTCDPQDLRDCRQVLCTASTLINDSLEEIIASVDRQARFELVGPSGSGLPDPLFARGVDTVSGISFADNQLVIRQLRHGEPWGQAGRKYQLDRDNYPGIEKLIAGLTDRGSDAGQA